MTSLENMVNHLKPLQLYNLAEGSAVCNELEVYAKALEESVLSADLLLKEIIVSTAEDYGLSKREELWGLPRTELTTEQRREAIKERFSIKYSECNLNAMKRLLTSLGVKATITETPNKYRVYIHADNGSLFSIPVRKYITEQAENYFPAHLEIFLDYRVATWDILDSHKTLFNTYDSFNFTWDRLEHLE